MNKLIFNTLIMESLIYLLFFIICLFFFCAKLSEKVNKDHKLSVFITRFGIVLIIAFVFTLAALLLNIINLITL